MEDFSKASQFEALKWLRYLGTEPPPKNPVSSQLDLPSYLEAAGGDAAAIDAINGCSAHPMATGSRYRRNQDSTHRRVIGCTQAPIGATIAW